MAVGIMLLKDVPPKMPGTDSWEFLPDGRNFKNGVEVKPKPRIKKRDREWLKFIDSLMK